MGRGCTSQAAIATAQKQGLSKARQNQLGQAAESLANQQFEQQAAEHEGQPDQRLPEPRERDPPPVLIRLGENISGR